MDDFNVSINGHSYTVLNFFLYWEQSKTGKQPTQIYQTIIDIPKT